MKTTDKIIEAGKKLAKLDPNSKALKAAREWWKAGCLSFYSNQDFDILNSLEQAILAIEKTQGETMQNGEYFEFNDTCPVHGGEIKAEYDFGMGDATVYTFHGCKCGVAHDSERGHYKGQAYFNSYDVADGYARLVVAGNAADDARIQ